MAELQHDRAVVNNHISRADDWPTLLGRMLDDLTKIIQMETRLFEANLSHALTGLLDRALSQLLLVSTLVAGGGCLLAGFIGLLHTWFVWWQSFAIAGATVIVLGVASYWFGQRAALKEETKIAPG